MAFSPLPFKVLGQVGPVLAWAEGDFGSRLPSTWSSGSRPFEDRERGWLLGELPTYSYDNVEDIIAGARRHHRSGQRKPAKLPRSRRDRRHRLMPPSDFDLIDSFRFLNRYFFIWNGTEPCIREGRMEELHELAIRLPAGHIVRHAHARAVSEGVIPFEEALKLPELVTLLPSNSFGMRKVIRRGLSESHLHLKAVVSAEETWADNLLKHIGSLAIRGDSPEERRLLVLNLFAGRLLAIAVWMSLAKSDEEYAVRPQHLLELMDRIYFARSVPEETEAALRLRNAVRNAVYGHGLGSRRCLLEQMDAVRFAPSEPERTKALHGLREAVCEPGLKNPQLLLELIDGILRAPAGRGQSEALLRLRNAVREAAYGQDPRIGAEGRRNALINLPLEREYWFLLRWISPTAFRLKGGRRSGRLPGNVPESLRDRHAFVQRLHLAAHLRLVQLSARRGEASPGPDRCRYFLHEALFRYMVCRTHHWQLATQQGQTTGLRHFRQYYSASQRKLPGFSTLQEAGLVFERLRRWRGLRVLEGRVGPPRSAHDLVPWILTYARPGDRRIEKFGLVVHFKKEEEHREEKALAGRIPPPVPRLRWGFRRRQVRAEGMCLYRLLRQPTPVTPFVVGIDACNLELATPPEVFAPVFRFLRELPISTARSGRRRFSPYYDLEPAIHRLTTGRRLGMTYHVGEDFRHLLSGLRAIHEVVRFLDPQPGDRLGHGTALALRPEIWLEHNGYQAVLSRLEWLDTLVWVHHFLGPGDDVVGELALEDSIQRLGWKIYSPALATAYDPLALFSEGPQEHVPQRGLLDWDWSPLALWDAWTLRQLDPYSVDLRNLFQGKLRMKPLLSFCEEEQRWYAVQERVMRVAKRTIGSRNAYLLLALYWLSPKVRRNGQETLVIDMKQDSRQWLELCRRVEEKMKALIRQREMVVEVNPSSNRIIGPMDRYDQNHLFQLTLDREQRLARTVRVSVNTDNPAVCNTSLAHEHYLVGEILVKKGVPEAEVVKWLEWLRQNGADYCFAQQLPTAAKSQDMSSVLEWLRGIRPGVLEAYSRDDKRQAFWDWYRTTWLRRRGFHLEANDREANLLERILTLEHALGELHRRGV